MGHHTLRPFSLSLAALNPGDTAEQVVITGQSLAMGGRGSPGLSTDEVLGVFSTGDTSFAYSVETANETPRGGLLRAVHADRGGVWAATLSAKSGTEYVGIKKGTATYTAAIDDVAQGVKNAAAARASLHVPSVHVIHGEADMREGTSRAAYAANLAEWATDYNTDIKAVTGQADDVGMIACQVTSWTHYVAFPSVGLAQLDAHRAGTVTLVGPKYQLEYDDGVHLTNAGYRHLGELHARTLGAVIDGGWDPVAPVSITMDGATITARFTVPSPPLVIDTSTIAEQTSYGFSYTDDDNPPAIESVEVTGPDEVTVTLAATPTGANPRLRYGCVAPGVGNLRDSEAAVSRFDGASLPNWCVHFDDPIEAS